MCNDWGKKVVMGVTLLPTHQQQTGKETHHLPLQTHLRMEKIAVI